MLTSGYILKYLLETKGIEVKNFFECKMRLLNTKNFWNNNKRKKKINKITTQKNFLINKI